MRDVRRYTGKERFLAATRVALSFLQANFATTRAQAITHTQPFHLRPLNPALYLLLHTRNRLPLHPCEGMTEYRTGSKDPNSYLFDKFCGTPTVASSSQALCHRRSKTALTPPCAKLLSRLPAPPLHTHHLIGYGVPHFRDNSATDAELACNCCACLWCAVLTQPDPHSSS